MTVERVRQEGGFTLIELLVAMMAATVVIAAICTILDVTMHQTTRTYTKVSADDNARQLTEKVEDELHSGCLAEGMAPVLTGSDATHLDFISTWGSSSAGNAVSPVPVEHQLTFSGGTLTDTTYAETSGPTGDPPTWTFSTTPQQTMTLATGLSANGATPVFQYFKYTEPTNNGTPYTDSAGNTYMMIQDGLNYVPGTTTVAAKQALSVPLSTADAGNTAEVLLNLVAGPSTGDAMINVNLQNVSATVQDQIVLRMSTTDNHAGGNGEFTPCA